MRAAVRIGAALACLSAALAFAGSASADVVDDNLAAVSRAAGDVVVFARGADGATYVREGIDGTWASLGGEATSGPAAAVRQDGTLDLYVRGTDEAIHHKSRPKGGDWTAWESLGGVTSTGPGTSARVGTDTVDLFVGGGDRALYHKAWNPRNGWSGWASVGGAISSAPSPVSRKTGWIDTYVRGLDNRIYNKSWTNGAWTPYDDVMGHTLSAPSAITRSSGNLDVFVRGTDRGLHQRSFIEGSGYTAWGRIDGRELTSGPAAVADGPSRVHVFAYEGTDVLVKSWAAGSGWAAWRSLGPVAPPAGPPPDNPPPGPGPGPSGPGPGPAGPGSAPVDGGSVRLGTGLSCTPRGQRMKVSVSVRKRPGRAKPRVKKVVFYYRKGKGKVARTDRRAPYRRMIPVDVEPGTHRVYAKIHYKRPGKRKLGIKTVSRRFAVCS